MVYSALGLTGHSKQQDYRKALQLLQAASEMVCSVTAAECCATVKGIFLTHLIAKWSMYAETGISFQALAGCIRNDTLFW